MNKATCSVGGCELDAKARGWCQMHYRRWQRNGNPRVLVRMKQPDVCSVDGCEHPCIARGWCVKHYHRWLKHGDVTAVAKSGRPGGTPKEPRELAFVCDVCGREFLRERKPGRPLTVTVPGPTIGAWGTMVPPTTAPLFFSATAGSALAGTAAATVASPSNVTQTPVVYLT